MGEINLQFEVVCWDCGNQLEVEHNDHKLEIHPCSTCVDALDLGPIGDKLRAENERLRTALEEILAIRDDTPIHTVSYAGEIMAITKKALEGK